MLKILQFYVSDFWVWLGITIGLTLLLGGLSSIASSFFG